MEACFQFESYRYIAEGIKLVIIRIVISVVFCSIMSPMTFYMSGDFYCLRFEQNLVIESKLDRRGKKLCNDVKEVA